MEGVVVRDAAADDAEAIRRIAKVVYHESYDGWLDPDVIEAILENSYGEELPELIASARSGDEACFLVAEAHAELAGYLFYGPGDEGHELHWIYADPRHLGAGVGTALLEELDRRLEPGTTYFVYVAGNNERAVHFYREHGFEDAGILDVQQHYGMHRHRSGLEDRRLRYTVPGGEGDPPRRP